VRRRELLVGAATLVAAAACRRARPRASLLVAGAKAMESYVTLLAAAFDPAVAFVVEAGGASASVIALKRGAIDVATMLRDFTEREEDPLLRNYLVARDGIAILVNRANPIKDLRMDDLRRIYARDVTSWREVGGADVPIAIVTREDSSHTQRSLRDILLGGDRMPDGRTASSREQMVAMVAKDPNAIGFSAFAGIGGDVSVVAVDSVPLTRPTIVSGRYPLSRSFYLVLYGTSTPAAERFVSFAIGSDGQAILEHAGLLPVY